MVVPTFLLPQDEGVATKSWNLDQHDPHQLPDLSSHPNFDQPLLYLPPLLSSPPEEISSDSVDIAYGNADYPSLATETRLPFIDPVSLSLHKALHNFRPVSFDYSTLPYGDAFNWSQLKLPIDEEREWYIVAFRSIRKVGSDSVCEFIQLWKIYSFTDSQYSALYNADRLAHEEAVRNGGVSLPIFHIYTSQFKQSRSATSILVWRSTSRNWLEPCNLYLAKPEACNSGSIPAPSRQRHATGGKWIRKIHFRAI